MPDRKLIPMLSSLRRESAEALRIGFGGPLRKIAVAALAMPALAVVALIAYTSSGEVWSAIAYASFFIVCGVGCFAYLLVATRGERHGRAD